MSPSRPFAALILLSVLAASPVLAAEVAVGSGRYEEDQVGVLAWRPKALAGPAKVAEVLLQDGPAKAGAQVATLKVEGQEDVLADAKRALADAQRTLDFAQEDADAQEDELEAGALRARADLEAARERRKHWLASDRADALLDSKQKVDNLEARVKEDREELRQLEQMYKEARIDSSTQDLVVSRERRKLKTEEVELEQATRRHQYYAATELPQADAALERAENEALLRSQAETRRGAREKARVEGAAEGAKRALKSAKQRLADLEADVSALAITVPVDGRVEGLSLKPGAEVRPGQELAKVAAETGGLVRIEVLPEALAHLPVGAPVRLRWPETGATAAGTVTEAAWAGRPEGARTLFTVVCKPARAEFSMRPGLKVEVLQDDGRRK